MAEPRYRRTAGSVYNLHYHVVFCPKYRLKVLVGEVAERLKELLVEKCAETGLEIEGMEIMPDHVHMFFSAPPTDAPQHFVNQLKGYSSRVLRAEFPSLCSRMPALWSRSYYVGSAGHVSAETILRYIASQRKRS